MIFKNLFAGKSEKADLASLQVDIHSHLLPGLDDGVENMEDALEVIQAFHNLGFKKLITTPHVMGDFFKNKNEDITKKLEEVQAAVKAKGIDIVLEAAAEYYLDEWFIDKVNNDKPLLTLGDKYVLIETSYINESNQLHEILFKVKSKGYIPVLAHPERYTYLYDDFSKYERIYELGALFQINTISLSGYYSKKAKQVAETLVDKGMVDFLGSDCHGIRHIEALKRTTQEKSLKKALSLNLLNKSLL